MKNIKNAKSLRFFLKIAAIICLVGIPYVFIVSRAKFIAYAEQSENSWAGLGLVILLIYFWLPFAVLSLINSIYSFALSKTFNKVVLGEKQTVRLRATVPYMVLTILAFIFGALSAFFFYGVDIGLAIIVFLELIFASSALRYSKKFKFDENKPTDTASPVDTDDSFGGETTGGGAFDALGGGEDNGLGGGSLGGDSLGGLDTFSATTTIEPVAETTEPVEEVEEVAEEVEELDELTLEAKAEGKKVLEKLAITEITKQNLSDLIDDVSMTYTDLMFSDRTSHMFKVYDALVNVITLHEKDLDYLNKFFF